MANTIKRNKSWEERYSDHNICVRENPKMHLEYLVLDERTILKWILQKHDFIVLDLYGSEQAGYM